MSAKVFKVVASLREVCCLWRCLQFAIIFISFQRLIHFSDQLSEIPNQFKFGLIFGFNSIADNNSSYCLGSVSTEEDLPSGTAVLGVYALESSLSDQEEGAEEEEGMTEAEENSETNEMIERDSPVELDEQQEQNEITHEVPHE